MCARAGHSGLFFDKKGIFKSFLSGKTRVFDVKGAKNEDISCFLRQKTHVFNLFLPFSVQDMCLKWYETICKMLIYSKC
jgi:hypothetical protein